jgi:hypothetical protein
MVAASSQLQLSDCVASPCPLQLLYSTGREGKCSAVHSRREHEACGLQHVSVLCMMMHKTMCVVLQVEVIKSRVGALYTFGQPRVGDYEVRTGGPLDSCHGKKA